MACIEGVLYCNDGDWVEHCTALVEDRNGVLSIWERRDALPQSAPVGDLSEAA
jgi:UDP-2,3-diacylglucosamine pyrophosphatase LpxH